LSNSQKSGPKTYDKQPNFGFWSDSFVEISKSFEPNCYSTVVHIDADIEKNTCRKTDKYLAEFVTLKNEC